MFCRYRIVPILMVHVLYRVVPVSPLHVSIYTCIIYVYPVVSVYVVYMYNQTSVFCVLSNYTCIYC